MSSLVVPPFILTCAVCGDIHAIEETVLTRTWGSEHGPAAVSSWLDLEPGPFWNLPGGVFGTQQPVKAKSSEYSIPMYLDVRDGRVASMVRFSMLFEGRVHSRSWNAEWLLLNADARRLLDLIGPPDVEALAELDITSGAVMLDAVTL